MDAETQEVQTLRAALCGVTDYLEKLAPLVEETYTFRLGVFSIEHMLPIWRQPLQAFRTNEKRPGGPTGALSSP